MVSTPNNYSTITVSNSITNTIVEEKYDKNKPFSFIEYLNYSKTLYKTDVNFTTYQSYLKQWNEITYYGDTDYNTQVREQFIDFLKTISLNYTTAEERRYLTTIDYNNIDEMEVAVPFFVQKIKDIILYYANKRDTYKLNYSLSLTKGSIQGVENFVRTSIVETLFGDDTVPYITLQEPLSTITINLKIEIEEGYDTYNDYFDLDPDKLPTFYKAVFLRRKYFTANTNKIDPNLFLDFDQAIIDLINSEGVVLAVLQNLAINIDTPDINLLQPYDFTDYSNVTRENLKLYYNAELIQKFTGTNFYYLSTNSLGQKLSGVLFESEAPYANLLNLHNPATLTIPQGLTKYERDVGLFFKPTNRSILSLQTPFSYKVKDEVETNKIYIFPDPNNYGNVVGVSKVEYETPLSFDLQGKDIQKNISSNVGIGHSLVTNNDLTFESYHSLEQTSNQNIINQIHNNGVITNYVSDIYGNIFVGFKQINTSYILDFENNTGVTYNDLGASAIANVPYLSSIKPLLNNGFVNTGSTVGLDQDNPNISTIYQSKYGPGNFYVYNIKSEIFEPFNTVMINVIEKYTTYSYTIQNQLQNIETFGSTFILTTSSCKIIDNVVYNGNFYRSANVPFILDGSWYDLNSNVYQVNDTLYVAKFKIVQDDFFNSNSRQFKLYLYAYSLKDNTYKLCNFADEAETIFQYSQYVKLTAKNVLLCYNKKINKFSVVVDLKDGSNTLFIQSINIVYNNDKFDIVDQQVYAVNNSIVTLNFYDAVTSSYIYTQTILTTPTINTTNGTIIF